MPETGKSLLPTQAHVRHFYPKRLQNMSNSHQMFDNATQQIAIKSDRSGTSARINTESSLFQP
jgi:hypothetical protein